MEAKKRIKIYVGIPSTGDRIDIQNYFWREAQERYGDRIELVFPEMCVHRIFHDFARNEVVEEFLATDCDILFFLDSDICPPKFLFDIVVNHHEKWEVAGAPYPLWQTPPGSNEPAVLLACYKGIVENAANRGIGVADVPASGTDWVDALATGCLFIKRSVFEKLEKPYFEFKYEPKTRKLIEGEDLGFALKLSKLGIKFFVDYACVCKHYKRVCLLDVNNYAVTMSNNKVIAYDREVRGQVEKAVQQAMDQAYKMGVEDGKKNQPSRTFQIKSETGLILPQGY